MYVSLCGAVCSGGCGASHAVNFRRQRMLNTGVYEQVEFQNAIMDNSGKLDKDGQIVRPTTFPVDVFMAVKESKFTSSIGGDICRGADNRPEAQAVRGRLVLTWRGLLFASHSTPPWLWSLTRNSRWLCSTRLAAPKPSQRPCTATSMVRRW